MITLTEHNPLPLRWQTFPQCLVSLPQCCTHQDVEKTFIKIRAVLIHHSQYRHLIIAILAIISVIVDQYGRNIDVVMTWPIFNTKEHVRGLAHSSVLEIGQVVTAPNRKQYYARLFPKIKTKQDDGDVFWWISGHVSLLKLGKICWRW